MDIQFKQSPQAINSNMQTLCRQLLPRCKFHESQYNADLIMADLKKNSVGSDGLVDASVANLLAAVQRLVNAIDWEVSPPPKPAPKPQPLFQGIDRGAPNENQAIIDGNIAIAKETQQRGIAAAKDREQKEILRVLHDAERLSKTAHRQTYSKALALREDLDTMLKAGLKKGITLPEAKALLQKMKSHADSNAHTPVGFLPQGWN